MPSRAARALLTGLIDYAGLFPPARLDIDPAVETFARCKRSEHEWILARFICPASRLKDLSRAAAPLLPGTFATSGYREHADLEPWRISCIVDGRLETDLQLIENFNAHHAADENGRAKIDTLEIKAPGPSYIDAALDLVPAQLFPYFEFPIDDDPRGFVAALAGTAAGAKVRTGGITPDAFPQPDHLAAFLEACNLADVPFKATAGLHHALRGSYPLTYEPDSPSCAMFGFLNLFTAAALIRVHAIPAAEAAAVLTDPGPEAFRLDDDGLTYRNRTVDLLNLARTRESFALSYGSCSFDEPIAELKRWL